MAIDNITRLHHMIDAAKEAVSFANGKSKEDLESDRLLLLALVKDLEIIGEAASKLTPEIRAHYPQLPWIDIITMRNRLVHEYFGIDEDIVWDTVTKDLHILIEELAIILHSETEKDIGSS